MEGSQVSIVRDLTWRPSLGPNNTTFGWSTFCSDVATFPRPQQHDVRMVDLLLFVFEGRKALLAPLG